MVTVIRVGPLLFLGALGLLAIGCGGQGEETPTPIAGLSCDRDPPLTYDNYGRGFMTQNCVPCHHALLPQEDRNGAPLGVDFETYEKVLAWSERIEARTIAAETMPPGGGLSQGELDGFEEWLRCGVAADKSALVAEESEGEAGLGGYYGGYLGP